jgi:hypothetical protein
MAYIWKDETKEWVDVLTAFAVTETALQTVEKIYEGEAPS